MNDKAKLELSVLAGALSLGILGDTLLRSFPWGLNLALWVGALAAAIAWFGRFRRDAFAQGGYWPLLLIVLFSLVFPWRDSAALNALGVLALLSSFCLLILHAQASRASSLALYALAGIVAGLNAMFGMLALLFGDTEWKRSLRGENQRVAAILRGALLALPPLLVFGALFMGADAVFKVLIGRILDFDLTHILIVGFIAFGVGGYLRGLLFGNEMKMGMKLGVSLFKLGVIEMAVILGLLDLLFLAFVVVQIRYFFGGAALVQTTTGLTYSEYARHGFFALLAVAAILLPFLLFVHCLLSREDAKAQSWFRGLAGIQIGLLFVVMASAFQRMRLYQAEYGLSEQRLYPTAFMVWLAVVFVWFCLTVLRGYRQRFAFGALLAGFLLIAVLQVLNPDALIARTNLARARAGLRFDANYTAELSNDAIPTLAAGLPDLNPRQRCVVAVRLMQRLSEPDKSDWRSWNYSRYEARKALRENESAIRAAVCSNPDFSMTH